VVNSISRRKSRIVRALVTPTARLILLAGNCLNRTELTHTVAVCEATLVWSSSTPYRDQGWWLPSPMTVLVTSPFSRRPLFLGTASLPRATTRLHSVVVESRPSPTRPNHDGSSSPSSSSSRGERARIFNDSSAAARKSNAHGTREPKRNERRPLDQSTAGVPPHEHRTEPSRGRQAW